jgi:hypothetical protein
MAPTPRISSQIESGQSTIINSLNGSLGIGRPTPRPGPKPKESTRRTETVLGRRVIGGTNEQRVLELFRTFRLEASDGEGEPGDNDLVDVTVEEDDDSEDEYIPRHRYAYPREHKLAAIEYFLTTWVKRKDGEFEKLSCRKASRRLKITRKMLRHWVRNRVSIENQRKGSKRARKPNSRVKEEQMEIELNRRFEQARAQGRKVSFKWILRHAREIYGEIHPDRVVYDETGKKRYLGFRWSPGWYRGFRRRYHISLRCGTKRAQKAPEDLRPVIQSWLQYNRRMTVITVHSDCGKQRDASVPTVGRFKLSEIGNMDQSPLPFELQRGRTYAKTGEKTVLLKGQRSGWDKRQCTLQIIVFADGIARCKPLLMFKGKPTTKDRRRLAEIKKYHPGVVVIFNNKAYANTSNLISWVKGQYSSATAYPLSDREPRLLCLDAFAPHKNKGRKEVTKESAKAKEKRLQEEAEQQRLRDEFAKLNVTTSIIPGGCTGYVQVLDVSINKIIKNYIEEAEDLWIDQNMEKWKSGQVSVGERRVLMTHWVGEAWEKLHREHKQTIINTFRHVGLSLNPDGSEDNELNIRDLPNITVGDYTQATTPSQPIIIPDDTETDTIEMEGLEDEEAGLLCTEKEILEGINEEGDPNDITTDSSEDSEDRLDSDSDIDFDEEVDGDEDEGDCYIDNIVR